ncbi:MAG: MopE-related protein, partial [Phycisphaerales bacterium]
MSKRASSRAHRHTASVAALLAAALGGAAHAQSNSVVCWGNNANAQCSVPSGLGTVQQIAGGNIHSVALKANGTVVCWGNVAEGQTTVPAGLGIVQAIAAGNFHTIALKSDGTVACWGRNNEGQCNVPAGLSGVIGISGGWKHTVALKSDGTVQVWGNNSSVSQTPPASLSGVTAVASGEQHNAARRSDGTVACWGAGTINSGFFPNYGQSAPPAGLSSVTKIAAGRNHTVAMRSNGTVACWGQNSNGQINVPAGLSGIVGIAAGQNHTLALRSNGTVVGWGLNTNGQLNTPASIGFVTDLAGGGTHTMAEVAAAPTAVLVSSTPAPCNASNGAIDVTVANASSVSWSGPGGFTSSSIDLSGLVAGSYTLTATGLGGVATLNVSVSLVPDTAPPVVTSYNASPSVDVGSDCTALIPDLTGSVVATDNCTPAGSLAIEQSPAAGTSVGIGSATITLTVRDALGNEAVVTSSLSVNGHSTVCYHDADGDSFGNPTTATAFCVAPEGWVLNGDDCDDNDAPIHPAADEDCDERDDDGDGLIDEDLPTYTYYPDADADGFGDGRTYIVSCSPVAPEGYVAVNGDCNDADAAVYPGAVETCADLAIDNDCDGDTSEEEASDRTAFYADADADGFSGSNTALFCTQPEGYAATDEGDCNDADALVYPGAGETCADLATDNDCDGDTSEEEAGDRTTFYADGDADGFSGSETALFCTQPEGYAATDEGDCNDADASVNPGAAELCADLAIDNDCDGDTSEEEASDRTAFYADADADGFSGSNTALFCMQPEGYAATDEGDCDDADALVYPGAAESCADLAVDNDCDGDMSDAEASDTTDYFVDADQDGFGAGAATPSCSPIEGSVANADDCDDTDGATYPGAAELCANLGTDNDCDGVNTEEEASDRSTFYQDADGDGFTASTTGLFCSAPAGYEATDEGDCNDADVAVFPGAPELCTNLGIDNDCDGVNDEEEATDRVTFYADGDGDGFSGSTTGLFCLQPEGFEPTDEGDCDDSNATVYPGATEICDDLDNDCNKAIDDGLLFEAWYPDLDTDGFGDERGDPIFSCRPIEGYVPNKRDCDDGNANVNPDAPEVCDALDDDEDCDNLADDADPTVLDSTRSDFYADADLDGYGAGTAVRFCDMPAGYAAVDTDCDDADKAINPGAFEICDAADTDENCNGLADDADGTTLDESRSDFYADNDLDGYGAGDATRACEMPAGSSHLNTDCNDTDPAINPGATEICDPENDDEDCDGLADDNDPRAADATKSDFYLDGDLDGFGAGAVVRYCDAAPGRSEFGTDCDDADAAVYPGAAELCADLAVDNDCDGDMS